MSLYSTVFELVGDLAPWRESTCANVIEQPFGSLSGIVEGTVKKGEYCPQLCEIAG